METCLNDNNNKSVLQLLKDLPSEKQDKLTTIEDKVDAKIKNRNRYAYHTLKPKVREVSKRRTRDSQQMDRLLLRVIQLGNLW